jgi:hypothetical protein
MNSTSTVVFFNKNLKQRYKTFLPDKNTCFNFFWAMLSDNSKSGNV